MNRARADLTYSNMQWDPRDECCRVCGPEGWHELHAGDAVKFPNGLVVSVDGPAEIGGGSLIACAIAIVIGGVVMGAKMGGLW